ncbi:HD-GYP domain-containing protein [Clostridium ganghwense]|uniref:HD domain-containing protein n=1 Tax=Clostridium ganghwense TaxID=312089 RepID=A0ABT4CRR1_9CLOT|nr:HD domain-containing phosphohydrolase [Clostridium ganghwense]MCY6371727.1 HD domain-containing protein [Clostridium ganghwense]
MNNNEIIKKLKYTIMQLNKIGIALSQEKDTYKLLKSILEFAMEFTKSDAGSLYTVEEKEGKKFLKFAITRNNSREIKLKEFTLNIDKNSIAGYAAYTGDYLNLKNVKEIPRELGLKYNDSFDKIINYKTINMLVVPMKDFEGNVIGVLQIINKKKDYDKKLNSEDDFQNYIIPYENEEAEMVISIASQVAVLFQRVNLYERIENLFKSFMETMVATIDARNPETAGHSKKVAILALRFAKAINNVDYGRYKDYVFSDEELMEFYYAALLHDIGKIGISENVLLKKNRLTDDRISSIVYRFKFIKRDLELKKLKKSINKEEKEIYNRLDDYLKFIVETNTKGYITEEEENKLVEIKNINYEDYDGIEKSLIDDFEFENLKVKRGNLTQGERAHIEKHVLYTDQILKKINWMDSLSELRNIVLTHHEKCNGTGYPLGLNKEQIPFKGKMLAILDIFEALTAKDRAYKKALSVEKSLSILENEVERGNLDSELFEIFKKEKVYEVLDII